MKVKCIATIGNQLPANYIDERLSLIPERKFHISFGSSYTVYTVMTIRERVCYFIADDLYVDYPRWYPAPLFEVVDNRLSGYWEYGFALDTNALCLSFPEWLADKYFYDQLTDGQNEAVRIFGTRKEQMDLEYDE
jgi:hypothetical protein